MNPLSRYEFTVETYIIRIYRRQCGRPEQIVGVSEHVETGSKQGFRNMHQLSHILLDESYEGFPVGENDGGGSEE